MVKRKKVPFAVVVGMRHVSIVQSLLVCCPSVFDAQGIIHLPMTSTSAAANIPRNAHSVDVRILKLWTSDNVVQVNTSNF